MTKCTASLMNVVFFLCFTQKKSALSGTVSEINAFLHLTQKFKMAAKNVGK